MKIGNKLRELREKSGLTVKDVINELRRFDITISEKTLYGYESGKNSTNADMFLALCQIYNCKNVIGEFSDSADEILFTNDEWNIIEKMRGIDGYGRETICMMLDREVERAKRLNEERRSKTIVELNGNTGSPERIIQYFQKVSAGSGELIYEDISEQITIPDIPKYKRVAYAVKVSGHSMEPKYHDGDMLLIEPACIVDIGEIGIFNVDNKAYVKKRGETELISLNEDYQNIPLTNESRCMGLVIDTL